MPEGRIQQPTQREPDDAITQQELDEVARPLPLDASLKQKLRHLHHGLECAASLEDQEPLDPPSLRLATSVALRAAICFLDGVGSESKTLRNLVRALDDLCQGHVRPLLTPPKSTAPGRRPDVISVQGLKAMAAAAMELRRQDMSKDDAAEFVANAIIETPLREYGGRAITYSTVSAWRDKYGANHPNEADGLAANIFRQTIELALANEPTPEKQAQSVIDTLLEMAARI